MEHERAVYIHIPFCISKCHYCDFNSYPGLREMFDSYSEAVRKEIAAAAGTPTHAATLYIGGGTPTVMSDQQLFAMIEAVHYGLSLPQDAETTIEANPATVDQGKLEALLTAGLNRISFGVQSFEDEMLKRIGRRHTAHDAHQAVIDARLVGFSNIGLDLIYALPSQTLTAWQDTLRQAVNLGPEHISLYELTIEAGTPFADMLDRGELQLPDEELQIEMYEAANDALGAAGYERYEISNFALPGFRSQHNQFYWRNREYWGFGAGAVSYVDGLRTKNVADPKEYIDRVEATGSAVESSEELPPDAQLGETIMLGLRMTEGVDLSELRQRFGVDVRDLYDTEIDRLTEEGLLETHDSNLRLTHRGVLLANEVMAEFVRSP